MQKTYAYINIHTYTYINVYIYILCIFAVFAPLKFVPRCPTLRLMGQAPAASFADLDALRLVGRIRKEGVFESEIRSSKLETFLFVWVKVGVQKYMFLESSQLIHILETWLTLFFRKRGSLIHQVDIGFKFWEGFHTRIWREVN